jgi:uncharacterized DUF497 family protein
MSVEFEWDPRKARSNHRKRGVTFEEAATAFGDVSSLTIHDPDHSAAEQRFVLLGLSQRGRLLAVAHRDRDDRVRIISARKATRAENRTYGESKGCRRV